MLTRLEYHKGTSHKYYQFRTEAEGVQITYGRCLGRDIVNGTRFVDIDTAEELMAQKQKKGYRIVSGSTSIE